MSPAESFTFCGDARFVERAHATWAPTSSNLANNHLTNYGAQGITSTDQLLHQHGILTSGLGPVAVIDVRGIKFGFIGFNGVGRAIDKVALKAGIARARQLADIVVVQFHWGKEYERQPMPDRGVPTPDDPVVIGHDAIDWGADIVIGNHPHWYQGDRGLPRQAHHLRARQLRVRPDVVGGDARGRDRHLHLLRHAARGGDVEAVSASTTTGSRCS